MIVKVLTIAKVHTIVAAITSVVVVVKNNN